MTLNLPPRASSYRKRDIVCDAVAVFMTLAIWTAIYVVVEPMANLNTKGTVFNARIAK